MARQSAFDAALLKRIVHASLTRQLRDTALALGLLASALVCLPARGIEFRSIDGSGNNLDHPYWGMAGADLLRLAPSAYEDGVAVPRGDTTSHLPSARAISNAINAQSEAINNAAGATDWFWQWGQFIDHDLDLTPTHTPAKPFNIAVPAGDPFFDPMNTGGEVIEFNRSLGSDPPNVREQPNVITSFIDGSQIYGSHQDRADVLRDIGNDGKMKMAQGVSGEFNLTFNLTGQPNAGGTGSTLYLSGDERANEQIGLTAVHTMFSREHNRIASDLKTRIDAGEVNLLAERNTAISTADNGIDNEDDFIYQSARKLVAAQIQKVTYEEFLPLLLGTDALGTYTAYDEGMNPGISNEFSSAAFRVGHTLLPSSILRVNDAGEVLDSIALRDAFFNPQEIDLNGIDSLLKGLASKSAQAVDPFVVDEVRNFLFGLPGEGGFDLAALNIQRGRDHGLSGYNATRAALKLPLVADFIQLTGGDADLANGFASVYGHIDDVDLWAGGLAEPHVLGAMIGETFREILVDQFTRTRSADRFYYELELDYLELLDPDFDAANRLSDIIRRNSQITSLQSNVFLRVPEPGSLALLLVGIFFASLRSAKAGTAA
jgi:hypothetical protein